MPSPSPAFVAAAPLRRGALVSHPASSLSRRVPLAVLASHLSRSSSALPPSSQPSPPSPPGAIVSAVDATCTDASITIASDPSTTPCRRTVAMLRSMRILATVAAVVAFRVAPVLASGGASGPASAALAAFPSLADPTSFVSGLTASFLLVLASEIGDKTFFISALLSMKYSRVLVLVGTMLALASMTIISVAIGQIFHALPASLNTSIPFDDYAAVALLLWFGFQNIRDGLAMRVEDEDELRDAKDVVAEQENNKESSTGVRVVAETSSLIFVAEWGDKSMLATVALAAAKSPLGVIVGGVTGHFVASIIAVVGGSVLGRYISERNARLIGGVLFFVFAVLTIFGIY